MSFLLDTNVVSELTKRAPHPELRAWFTGVASVDLFLSVITLGEIRKGIEQRRTRSAADAERLEAWLHALTLRYRPRILSFDEETSDRWGRIMALYPRVPVEDGQLAATAQQHNLTFATRNVRHVAMTGVPFVNPFDPTAQHRR